MKQLKLIHFEHAVAPLADMGLEQVVTPLFRAVLALPTEDMTPEQKREALKQAVQSVMGDGVLENVFAALVKNADTKATRRLLAVLGATAEEIFDKWENGDGAGEKEALRSAALMSPAEAAAEIAAFFGWLGLSRASSLVSSGTGEGTDETAQASPAPSADSADS